MNCFKHKLSSQPVGQSVGWSVGRSNGRSVGRSVTWSVRSVGRSVGRLVTKQKKTHVFEEVRKGDSYQMDDNSKINRTKGNQHSNIYKLPGP